MEKAIAKLTKENHLNTLIDGLPLLTTIYGINCLMAHYLIEGIDIGSFSLGLGVLLVSFISALFVYDKYHHVLLYRDHMLIYFQPLGHARKIDYHDIHEVITVEEDVQFSSILIKMKDKSDFAVHFIDHPQAAKKFLDEIKKNKLREDIAA